MRIIEVIADAGHQDTLSGIAEQHGALDHWSIPSADEDNRVVVRILVVPEKRQAMLDALQNLLGSTEKARIVILPVEATLPRPEKEDNGEDEEQKKNRAISTTREELYNTIEKDARLDHIYIVMVFLSTIVAAIGLIENNVAVVVGAMVIAPLLGPNIALAFATSLGDRELMWQSMKTNLAGLGLALSVSLIIGLIWPVNMESQEIMSRTDVNLAGVALALASGAAAVLSLTTGVSSVLVGVMVAVALLPPTATLGMMLGSQQYSYAAGAALLLAVNVVCVNLSAKLVFLMRGVKPRTWWEKQKARQSMAIYILFWVASLAVLLAAMYLRHNILD